jgi:hypothetical protein
MTEEVVNQMLDELSATIEIPDSAYETAEGRYRDLGQWFGRPEAACSRFQPCVSVQGSFCLGTVNRPVADEEPYDLDLVCTLKSGIHKKSASQEELKILVGHDIESYRIARRIEESIKEKHRCWRIEYADSMRFHMDILPSIPEGLEERRMLCEAMVRSGTPKDLADSVANLAVSITDNRHPTYQIVSANWYISNPAGFSRWFESRVKLASLLLEKRLFETRVARVEDLPVFRWKLPLQRVVQLLKRHRDIMFADNCELKPTSNILTALAGLAYRGEQNLGKAISMCLSTMGMYVQSTGPRVPNPVNPAEDFADKWSTVEGRALNLEANFKHWLEQAKADFNSIGSSRDPEFVAEQALTKLGIRVNSERLLLKLGVGSPVVRTVPRIQRISETPARPWRR